MEQHPFIIHTFEPAPPPRGISGNKSRRRDEAFADSLPAALAAAKQLVEDAGDTPISKITITLESGHCIVEGEPQFSAAWR